MNILAEELAKRFEEVPAMEFYREVFPEGELDGADELTPGRYTGIAVEITNEKRNGKQVIRRYTVTDDLDEIDRLQYSDNFCILAPISYAGKSRISRNARFMYAFVVELDNLIVNRKKEQIGLKSLIAQWSNRVHWIPKPTYLVASGTGVHLYYLLEKPVPLFGNVAKELAAYKRDLTEKIWNRHVTWSCTKETIQQESVFQAFRMVGTVTKLGDRVQAFRRGLITYPVNSIANRSGIAIPKNKRNFRKQTAHLQVARAMRAVKAEIGENVSGGGRPSQEQTVREWQELHLTVEKRTVSGRQGLRK